MSSEDDLFPAPPEPTAFAPLTSDEEDKLVGSMVRERGDLARRTACLAHRIDCAAQQLRDAARVTRGFCEDESLLELPDFSYPSLDDVLAQTRLLSEASERARVLSDRLDSLSPSSCPICGSGSASSA